MATFAENITVLREEKGKKRQEIADDLGISRASLEYYEKGKRKPDIDVLVKFANYYGVSADYLLGLAKDPTTKIEEKAINEYTGLSSKAIQALNDEAKNQLFNEKIKVINFFLDEGLNEFESMCRCFNNYYNYYIDYISQSCEALLELEKGTFDSNTKEVYDLLLVYNLGIENFENIRDVQKLKIHDSIMYLLNNYSVKAEEIKKSINNNGLNFDESMTLFKKRMSEIETALSIKYQKDGVGNGNDQQTE